MRFPVVAALVSALIATAVMVNAQAPIVEVYKSPTCGCCSKWVEHLQQDGFTVRVTDLDDTALDALKSKRGVPRTAQSCHTALVGGYVIEGHVPATEVRRLLKERPSVAGLAVAGMPLGSPGMEVPGRKPHTYNVISFDKAGATRIFSTQNR